MNRARKRNKVERCGARERGESCNQTSERVNECPWLETHPYSSSTKRSQWFPEHKGLINGLIVAGFGSGGAIFNQVITQYLNPENLKPSQIGNDGKAYFVDETILNKVTKTFLILGEVISTNSFFCFLLVISHRLKLAECGLWQLVRNLELFQNLANFHIVYSYSW